MKLRIKFSMIVLVLFYPLFMRSNCIYQIKPSKFCDSIKGDKTILYEVTETINMTFGGRRVSYTVSDRNLINTNYLGPNNTRVIKEKVVYKTKTRYSSFDYGVVSQELNSNFNIAANEKESLKTIAINPLDTYERMVNKGFKSVEILKKLGDSYFYKNEYVKASKYYEALFKITNNINSEYYFRYSQSLKSIGQYEQSEELLKRCVMLKSKQLKLTN
jgi:tetratricopeptide (TPR) repeat protein